MTDLPPAARVMQVLIGAMNSAAVSAIARLGIPDHLQSGPKTIEELAHSVDSNRGPKLGPNNNVMGSVARCCSKAEKPEKSNLPICANISPNNASRPPKPGVAGSSPATPAKNQRLSLIAGIEGYIRGNIWGSGRRPLNGVRKAHKSDPGLAEHRAARGVRKVRGRNDQLAGLIEPSHDADAKPFVCAWID